MTADSAQGERHRAFPTKGLVLWPLVGWGFVAVVFVLMVTGVDELATFIPLSSTLLVLSVAALGLIALSQLVLIPLGTFYFVSLRSVRTPRAALALLCGTAHLTMALLGLWAMSSALALHAA